MVKANQKNKNKNYYQDHELGIVHYEYYKLTGGSLYFRGPKPDSLETNSFFCVIGAAQTFGRFAKEPFCQIISDQLDLPCLNLGYAGAGPSFYLINNYLLNVINRSKFVIVQVMSGRSESNSRYYSHSGRNILKRVSDNKTMMDTEAFNELLRSNSLDLVREIVQQTRYSWLKNIVILLEKIKTKKCLFWFSTRSPEYKMSFDNVKALMGEFPHLIDTSLINTVKPLVDEYVECVSNVGLPQKLVANLTDGKDVEIKFSLGLGEKAKASQFNRYYPSPEMHIEAAKALSKTCQKLASPP